MSRTVPAVLALLSALLQLLLLLVIERQVRSASALLGPELQVSGLRYVWAVVAPLPWLVGAWLLLRSVPRPRIGTAVLVTAAALSVPAALPSLPGVLRAGWWRAAPVEILATLGSPVLLLLAVGTAATALRTRPRGGWRLGAPGPVGVYVAVAVLAWLPTAFQTLERSPPGAMRSIARTELSRLEGVAAVASVTGAVVAAAVLLIAPRLRPAVAGAVLLVLAVPELLRSVGDLAQLRDTPDLIVTPPAVLGMIGLVGVVLVALYWLVTARDRMAAADGPGR